jgi:hypothetical protein
MITNVFDFIKAEETNYKTQRVPVADGYEWNMYEHLRKCTLYRDSKYTTGADDGTRPYKNIIRRIRNLHIIAQGFDVKDIMPFVNESNNYYKSAIVRKYHPKWARKHNIDTYIDELVESYEDYGGALSKHVNKIAPEVVNLNTLAFCDQTDILSGPICIKHQYSPEQLKAFEGKWENIDEVIMLARKEKSDQADDRKIKTPGRYIEVYELDGEFPKAWLKDDNDTVSDEDEVTLTRQMHIVTYYQDEKGDKKGIRLFKGKGDKDKYKFVARDAIFGRALGFSGIEELFEAQIWTNYNMIRIQEMLDAAAKQWYQTADPTFATRNNINGADNNEVFVHAEGKPLTPVNTQIINLPAFTQAVTMWEDFAQGISSSNDALFGETPTAGTPFKLQEALIQQGSGLNEYRKGKLATHLGEIYRDWILSDLVKELNKEQEFFEELSLDEMEYFVAAIINCEFETFKKKQLLQGVLVRDEDLETAKQEFRAEFMKDNKKFIKVMKDELAEIPVDVEINIVGKQKNLALLTDKLTNVFRNVFSNPQILDDPRAAKIFNMILENSGLEQMNFQKLAPQVPQLKQLQEQVA